ncbi:hypothetical protein K7X08_017635 [Anisodus acutangulus]|uniref:Gamma-tubulin complex component n=1 Tax=Anisodus acutangulus TaxID=402998 RepID=A0A9Q1LUJ1_9SOLA|nr:hypothetical protein K7X08_017635 [Anisodus acutangulus]
MVLWLLVVLLQDIFQLWVYEGVIDDPYGEFFIAENKSLQKESLTQDYDAKYWQQCYSLKDDIPSFLANAAETILITGKYLNVMRECGHSIQIPVAEKSKLTSVGSNHHYLECVKSAYDFVSGELNLVKNQHDLVGKLQSIKHYLLLDQGDFLVHFMDTAREELMKKPDEISVEKLQSLLDLALRSTAAAADPCRDDLLCCVEKTTLLKRLSTLKDLEISRSAPDSNDLEEPLSITGLETFSLNYKVRWPLSLVISRKALTKYQLIFRFLFHCKHVDRQLSGAWQVHQGLRKLDMQRTTVSVSSLLCRNMLKFINSLLHYLTFEVLEPNWHVMLSRLQTAKSIDECLRECLLLSPALLKKVERLKLICLQYAPATQWLITSSLDIADTDKLSNDSPSIEKYKNLKLRTPYQMQKLAPENVTVFESVLKFEREFTSELHSLGPILSSGSRAEPYLTHLAVDPWCGKRPVS